MASEWSETKLETLRALCDCLFPSLEVSPDPHGFWARKASDFGIDVATAAVLDGSVPEPARTGLMRLLDALSAQQFAALSAPAREQVLHAFASASPQAALGIATLSRLVLSLCYALPDAQGQNANWAAIQYPGPPRSERKPDSVLTPIEIERDESTLDADVCIVGSGAGGGVTAGELARRGLSVVVLEMGGYHPTHELPQLELWAYQNMYWRGGVTPTADGTVNLLSGATLGGGTSVNWHNCVRTPSWVRDEWAREHGLEGLESASFDAQLDGVLERILANDRCSDLNGPHQALERGAEALGYAFRRCLLNLDPSKYDAGKAGFSGFGDATGSRMGTTTTYLADAQRHGARIVVRAKAQRILTSQGRASGVAARVTGRDGVVRQLLVRARHVVVAGGALETPALLLRSNLGGPAAGRYLHLHPVVSMTGVYADDQRAWWGPPQSGLSDALLRLERDHGILFEGTHHSTLIPAASLPWTSGRAHKETMLELPRMASFLAIVRDHGHGRVELDPHGESMPLYPVQDPLDVAHLQRGLAELARLHRAAGAQRILTGSLEGMIECRPGDDFDAYVARVQGTPGVWPGRPLFSAHQMGSARMGKDRETSVAQPTGELHDVKGVWIGDTSAFPSALGVNPMVTCMALAVRTASFIE